MNIVQCMSWPVCRLWAASSAKLLDKLAFFHLPKCDGFMGKASVLKALKQSGRHVVMATTGSTVCEGISAAWFGGLRKCWGLQAEHLQGWTPQPQCQGKPEPGGHPDLVKCGVGQCHPVGCDFKDSLLLLATKSKCISKEKKFS